MLLMEPLSTSNATQPKATFSKAAWINLLLFKLSWLLLVLGQDQGLPWALGLQLLSLACHANLRAALPPALSVAALGILVDAACGLSGFFRFPGDGFPAWLAVLWLAFGLVLQQGLQFLRHIALRYQILLGAALGPLAYGLGARFGAVDFGPEQPLALSMLALLWAALLPLSLRLRLQGRPALAPVLLGLLLAGGVQGVHAEDRAATPLVLIGEARLDWLFRTIYEARLYAANPGFRFPATQAYLLELEYRLSIKGTRIAAETLKQWQAQGVEAAPAWAGLLEKLLPDVASGDRLALQVAANGHGTLLFNGSPLARLEDPDFVAAFAGIWLADSTTRPDLRRQLLGLPR